MLKDLKTFYKFIFKYKKDFIIFLFVLFLATTLQNILPYFYKVLIDAIPLQDYEYISKIILYYIILKIIITLLNTSTFYLGDKSMIPASKDARLAVFRKIQDLDFAFHVNKNTGSLISAFKRGDGAFMGMFETLHHHILDVFISLVVVLIFFYQVVPSIVGVMALIFLINIIVSVYLIRFNISKRVAFNATEDKISGIITDNLINYETVKFFAQEEKEEDRLKTEFQEWVDRIWAYANTFRLMDVVIGTLSNLGIFVILKILVSELSLGAITTGDFIMVLSFLTSFYYRFFELLYSLREIAKKQVDLQTYFALLDNEILIKDPEKPVKVENIQGHIQFKDVSFKYPDGNENILTNINLDIKPGESIAFIGRSGAGKTTIVKLLLRFYDTNSGAILIDNTNIAELTKAQLRSFIGIVPQEPILFNNTIGFNVAYGNDKASKKDIAKACRMANLHDFIEKLSLKYETMVGERGIKLSGGQKQRLAIARMILANPKIIIFDEATSNLDSESEHLIQDALWKISKDRTVLIIAHRFSTVRKVDRVIVLDKGEIVESGTHKELTKKNGLYVYLREMQTKDQEYLN
ncbi:MAG: ABC transporter ATP-binding protein [Patescibacteria group bacterium]